MAEAPSELPEGEIMAGRSKPAPLRMAELGKPSDSSRDSSPMGAALMARKAERQKDSSLQGSMASPDGECDSPGWETNFSRMQEEDSGLRQNNSSLQASAICCAKRSSGSITANRCRGQASCNSQRGGRRSSSRPDRISCSRLRHCKSNCKSRRCLASHCVL